jgi:hypothetical protein
MSTLLTIGCIVSLVVLGIVIARMFAAIKRDTKEMDEERERELHSWRDEV